MGQQGIIHLPLLRQLVIQSRTATGIDEVAAFHGLLGRIHKVHLHAAMTGIGLQRGTVLQRRQGHLQAEGEVAQGLDEGEQGAVGATEPAYAGLLEIVPGIAQHAGHVGQHMGRMGIRAAGIDDGELHQVPVHRGGQTGDAVDVHAVHKIVDDGQHLALVTLHLGLPAARGALEDEGPAHLPHSRRNAQPLGERILREQQHSRAFRHEVGTALRIRDPACLLDQQPGAFFTKIVESQNVSGHT